MFMIRYQYELTRYALMRQCWSLDEGERPSFRKVQSVLQLVIENEEESAL